MIYLRWLAYFVPALLIEVLAMLLTPLIALFVTTELRTDRVKRLGNQTLTMERTYLIKVFRWFQSHDNAVDEYWYGLFTEDSVFRCLREATQEDYDRKGWLRYLCRMLWMWRNCAYGFHYHWFSRILDAETVSEYGTRDSGVWWRFTRRISSFHLKAQFPISKKFFISINIGWKTHTGFPRCMYANRFFSIHGY